MRYCRVAGASLTIAAVFLFLAGDGLSAYFTPDDMMNLYGAWFRPVLEQGRPLGALVYRAIFAVFGLDPLPYRMVCFLLLAGNLVLPRPCGVPSGAGRRRLGRG